MPIRNPHTTPLGSLDERMFQEWYRAWAKRQGWADDPDDPRVDYDYRGLWKSRQDPAVDETDENTLHWTSEFKRPGHSRSFIPWEGGYLNTKTMQVVPFPTFRLHSELLGER